MKAGSKNLLRHAALGALLWATFIVFVAHAAEPRYTDLRLSDVKDGSPKQIFAPTTAKIFLTAKLVDVPTGAKLKGAWIAEKTKAAPPNYLIDSVELTVGPLMNSASFAMSKPNAGWPLGDYRVELSINRKLVNTVRFKVAP
jgi:hypothetical protein